MEEERKKYRVFKANIMDEEGKKRKHDDIVSLSPKLARHYNKLGFLRPYMDEDAEEEDDEDDDTVGDEAPKLARSRRAPAVTPST